MLSTKALVHVETPSGFDPWGWSAAIRTTDGASSSTFAETGLCRIIMEQEAAKIKTVIKKSDQTRNS
jgi:hypothetical protein